jgi:iron(III) transport system permease protein
VGRRLLDWWNLPALPVAAPVAYLLWLALTQAPPDEVLQLLQRANVLQLVWQSGLVALVATAWACAIGVPWGWLVARTDIPGRAVFRWLAPLPLAVPPYVGALVYASLLAPGGALHQAVAAWQSAPVPRVPFPDVLYSPFGAGFVLGTFTAPHVTLAVMAGLDRSSPSLLEAAQSLGHGARSTFWRVTLPLLRPAILSGCLLVFVYGWVDFGAVSLLRVRTFTTAIYNQLLAGFSLPASAALSLLLVAFALGLLALQGVALGQARYSRLDVRSQRQVLQPLGAWRWFGFGYLVCVGLLTLGVPLGVLGWQTTRLGGPGLAKFVADQLSFLGNSVTVAVAGATVALALGCLYSWVRWSGGRRGELGVLLLQAGYGVPGTVLGLGLVGLTLAVLPPVYGTPLVLVVAYAALFAAPALQSVSAALASVPRRYAEAARALGRGPLSAFASVVGPLIGPGLVGAWLLVFALAMRELSATIILRPAGFDTLAVRVWVHTLDVGPDPRGAAAALLLILTTGAAWLLAMRLERTAGRQAATRNPR